LAEYIKKEHSVGSDPSKPRATSTGHPVVYEMLSFPLKPEFDGLWCLAEEDGAVVSQSWKRLFAAFSGALQSNRVVFSAGLNALCLDYLLSRKYVDGAWISHYSPS